MMLKARLGDAHESASGVGGGFGGQPRQRVGDVPAGRDVGVRKGRCGCARRRQQREVVDEQHLRPRRSLSQRSADFLEGFGDLRQRSITGKRVELIT